MGLKKKNKLRIEETRTYSSYGLRRGENVENKRRRRLRDDLRANEP